MFRKFYFQMVILALCTPVPAFADSAIITWTAPTERTDGTPPPADEIGGYILRVDGTVVTDTIPGADTTYTISGLAPSLLSYSWYLCGSCTFNGSDGICS